MMPNDANLDQLKRVMSAVVHDEVDVLFLPIFIHGNHWILAVIHFTVRLIEVYDSLDGNNADVVTVLLRRISDCMAIEIFGNFRTTIVILVSSIRMTITIVPFSHVGMHTNLQLIIQLPRGMVIGMVKLKQFIVTL
jgi:hypothetical protein